MVREIEPKQRKRETPEEKSARASAALTERWRREEWRTKMRVVFETRPVSDETREKRRMASTGVHPTEETIAKQSEKQGGTRNIALPLILRGATVREVMEITGLREGQVSSLIRRLREKTIQKSTEEERRMVRSKVQMGKQGRGRKVYSPEEERGFALAGKLLREGFFTADTTFWGKLHEMYVGRKTGLPDNIATKLRLEAYLIAISGLARNNMVPLFQYRTFGDEVDSKWARSSLASHEAFITIKYFSPWADGEDQRGLYKITTNGKNYIPTGPDTFDTTRQAITRAQVRDSQERQ